MNALKGKIEENKKLLSEKEKVTKALSIKQETFQKEYAGASKTFLMLSDAWKKQLNS